MRKEVDCDGFNPTLVRLRRARAGSGAGRPARFQSHAGSIEAAKGELRSMAEIAGFNPTLVRLRRDTP